MPENRRVRAIMFCAGRGFVLIRREKPGEAPYFVFPGGGVDAGDASDEAALNREIAEELGAKIENLRHLGTLYNSGDSTAQEFFYGECSQIEPRFVGHERDIPGRGTYGLIFVEEERALEGMNVLPRAAIKWLLEELRNRSRG